MQFIYSVLLRLTIWSMALAALSACAGDTPAFTPPDQRPTVTSATPWPENHFIVLAYHDVEDADPDQAFVSVLTARLREQFAWLHAGGYHPVSIDQILAARNGGPPLPDKAILLCFDDGYSSFYTRVFPLLQAYQWPALLAPVGAWLDTPAGQPVDFAGAKRPRGQFLNWQQVTEMSRSGLVEVGAHTYDLHKGIPANPQGNMQPAATTLRYEAATGQYESPAHFRARIRADVKAISDKVYKASSHAPRVWVWPYGAVSGESLSIVDEQGYSFALTLLDGLATVDHLMQTPRLLVNNDPSISSFANSVTGMGQKPALRVAHIDIDYVYDPDPAQTERNLGQLVQRIADMQINTVFLQAFADPDADGLVKSVYFPNSVLPMRADLFNRVAWQLRNRAHVAIYAWLPVLSLDLSPDIERVMRWDAQAGKADIDPAYYQRLSVFDPAARAAIIQLYEDLSRQAVFDGILFHDDALLTDFEDASPHALAAYKAAGLPGSIEALRADSDTMWRWTRFKTKALTDFTLELAEHVRAIRGSDTKTARNLYAQPILEPESEQWYAQNLDNFLESYDWTAPMAMPLMENVPENQARAWLDRVVDAVATRPRALDKTIFEVQARDWSRPDSDNEDKHIDSRTVAKWLQHLQLRGVRSMGYYPDDFVKNHPRLEIIRPAISNAWYPYR